MTKLEDRIRNGLHETAERIPETEVKLREATSKGLRPFWVGVTAVLGVLVLFSPLFLLNESDSASAPEAPTTPPFDTAAATESEAPAPVVDPAAATEPEAPAPVVDPEWLTVEPEDLAALELMHSSTEEWAGELRQPLNTEMIWCLYTEGPGHQDFASDFPINNEVTLADIEAACEAGAAQWNLESVPDAYTVCSGVLTDTANGAETHGWTFGFPVVLGWEAGCDSVTVDTNRSIVLSAELDLNAINRARNLEIAATGAAIRSCLTHEEAQALAAEIGSILRNSAEPTGPNTVGSGSPQDDCYQPFFDLEHGVLTVDLATVDQSNPLRQYVAP